MFLFHNIICHECICIKVIIISQADTSKKDTQFHLYSVTVNKPTSLGTLIVWNISKALDKSPDIDLRVNVIAR